MRKRRYLAALQPVHAGDALNIASGERRTPWYFVTIYWGFAAEKGTSCDCQRFLVGSLNSESNGTNERVGLRLSAFSKAKRGDARTTALVVEHLGHESPGVREAERVFRASNRCLGPQNPEVNWRLGDQMAGLGWKIRSPPCFFLSLVLFFGCLRCLEPLGPAT